MGSLRWGFLAPAALLLAVVGRCSGASSPSHSLHFFYTAVSEPSLGLPQFLAVGQLDEQPFVRYDSHSRKVLPQVPWVEKVREEDPRYWQRNTQRARGAEPVFRANLVRLWTRHSQKNSTGLHTLQWMYGCDVGPDRWLSRGHYQFAYDGEDFPALDMKTLAWTASTPLAKISRQKLDAQLDISQHNKDYLEGTCVEWLQRYLDYGKETLLRTEAPTARVALKKGSDGRETLTCHLYGFYPKEIEVTWMKDGEDQKPETVTGGVVPNSDGTYHTWLSIDIDSKERSFYRCRVGHGSLPGPLDLAWEEPATRYNSAQVITSTPPAYLVSERMLPISTRDGETYWTNGRPGLRRKVPHGRKAPRGGKGTRHQLCGRRCSGQEEEELDSNLGLILGVLGGVTALSILVGAMVFLRERQKKGYKAAWMKRQLQGGYKAASKHL